MDEPTMSLFQNPTINDDPNIDINSNVKSSKSNYVSVFRLNQKPILPPLMTPEKRRQMQKIRDKAMALEKFLAVKRLSRENEQYPNLDTPSVLYPTRLPAYVDVETEPSCSARSNQSKGSLSSEKYAKYCDEVYDSLTDMMKSVEVDTRKSLDEAEELLQQESKIKCMKKLKQSDTLIYDNTLNEIILPLKNLPDAEFFIKNHYNLDNFSKEELNYLYKLGNKQNKENNSNASNIHYGNRLDLISNIPEICIDPPTPMIENLNLSESLKNAVSSDNQNCESDEDNTTDESSEEVRIGGGFEQDSLSMKASFPNNENCIRRSATIPVIKIHSNDPNKSEENEKKLNNTETLIRSNSFTMDSPSKALIDHMKKQKLQDPSAVECALKETSSKTLTLEAKRSQASFTRDTIESRAKKVKKIEVKQNAVTKARANKAKQTTQTNVKPKKTTRSPYDAVLKNDPIVQKAIQNQNTTKKSNSTKKSKPPTAKKSKQNLVKIDFNVSENFLTVAANEVLGQIEASHREKFMKLIAEQALEQQKMQQAFELQQRTLLEQLKKDLSSALKTSNGGSPDTSTILDVTSPRTISQMSGSVSGCTTPSLATTIFSNKATNRKNSPTNHQHQSIIQQHHTTPFNNTINSTNNHQNVNTPATPSILLNNNNNISPKGSLCSSNRCSPRRRLFPQDNESINSQTTGGSTYRVPIGLKQQNESMTALEARRHKAATIINAHVRGFLVRRLFQTEQIQRIAQTVKDTLVFVINLHLDSVNNPDRPETVDSIRLKARLLRQLEAASRTLHLVLFQTTMKERMDIIARDRNRIKARLKASNIRRQSESLSINSLDLPI